MKLTLVLTALLSLTAFSARAENGVSNTEIKIGVANDTSGKIAGTGKAINAGVKAAFDAINAKGGVHGRKLVAVFRDDKYDPLVTVAMAKELIETENVFALMGFNAAATVKAAATYLAASHPEVPYLFPRAGDQYLREPGQKNIFNLRAGYMEETDSLIKAMVDKKRTKIAFLSQNDQLGKEMRAAAIAALKKHGVFDPAKGTPFVVDATSGRDVTDLKPVYKQLEKADPDVVVVGMNPKDAASVVKLAVAGGKKWTFVATSMISAMITELNDTNVTLDVVMTQALPGPDSPLPLAKEYLADLEKAGEKAKAGYLSLEGYLEARVVAEALKRAGKDVTREKFVKALESDAFDIGGFVVEWTPSNHNAPSRVVLTQLKDKKLVTYTP